MPLDEHLTSFWNLKKNWHLHLYPIVKILNPLNNYTNVDFGTRNKSLDQIEGELEILPSAGFCSKLCKNVFWYSENKSSSLDFLPDGKWEEARTQWKKLLFISKNRRGAPFSSSDHRAEDCRPDVCKNGRGSNPGINLLFTSVKLFANVVYLLSSFIFNQHQNN